MKTAEQYSRLSFWATIAQFAFLIPGLPNWKYDWVFIIASLACAAVSIYTTIRENLIKNGVSNG